LNGSKYIHSGDALRNPFEHQLNNKRQVCKIDTECGGILVEEEGE
jgi:hypothetical protein